MTIVVFVSIWPCRWSMCSLSSWGFLEDSVILLGFPLSKEQTKARPNEALVLALVSAVG